MEKYKSVFVGCVPVALVSDSITYHTVEKEKMVYH